MNLRCTYVPSFLKYAGLAALGCFLVLSPVFLRAQLPTATVTGTIYDASGAVVPGAGVTLTNTSKGFTYSAASSSAGLYTVPNLEPGTYTLRVEAKGFSTYAQQGIQLVVNQVATVDVVLQVGASAQTVEVTGAPPILEAQNAQLGQTVSGTMVRELPLVGRDAEKLISLAPGVNASRGHSNSMINDTNVVSNGMRNSMMDVLADGTTLTTSGFEIRSLGYVPSVEVVAEFKVEQNNYSAEHGFTGPTVVSMATRSGTNQFHGDGFEFVRNDKFDANDFFANRAGLPIPPLRWNDFGANLGGPIQKNKTFFFFQYEGQRQAWPSAASYGVPSQSERNGDFGEICANNGGTFDATGKCSVAAGQIWDPYTASLGPNGQAIRTAFIPFNNMETYQSPGDPALIGTVGELPATPGNLINPTAQKIMSYYPLPNINVGKSGYNPYNNFESSGAGSNKFNNYDTRVDHRFNDVTQGFARVHIGKGTTVTPQCYPNAWDPCGTGPQTTSIVNTVLNVSHNFGGNKLLTLTYGFVRNHAYSPGVIANYPEYNAISDVGFPSYFKDTAAVGPTPGISMNQYATGTGLVLAGGGTIGQAGGTVYNNAGQTHDILGSLEWIAGRHDVKMGGELRIAQNNLWSPGSPQGAWSFNQLGTSQFSNSVSGGGDAMATLLMGVDVGGGGGSFRIYQAPALTGKSYSGYIQDNWRATKKLTLNLGLRYDVQPPATDRWNRMEYFDPAISNPLQVPGMDLKGGEVFGAMYPHTYYGQWQPRLGLAYRLNDKTVLRGGVGIYYEYSQYGPGIIGGAGSFDGYMPSTPWQSTYQNNGYTPWGALSNPFPGGLVLPTGKSLGALTNVGFSPTGGFNATGMEKIPSDYAWSLGLQRELPGHVLVEANYVGTKGTHLLMGLSYGNNVNYLGPSVETLSVAQLNALNARVTNPFYGIIMNRASCLSGPTVPAYQLSLPYPQHCGIQMIDPPWGNSNYNALQMRVEKRLSRGLEFLVTYTWSKSMDNQSATPNTSYWGGSIHMQDPNRRYLERSVSQFNDPHVLNFSYIYQLPFGQGKHWGSSWNGPANAVLGGWETTGLWTFDTGMPFTIGWASCGVPFPSYNCQRPNLNGKMNMNGRDPNNFFPNANQVLSKPAPYTLGTLPGVVPTVHLAGARNADLAIYKKFSLSRLREGASMQIRLEGTNAFNRPQFGFPGTSWGSSNFGKVGASIGFKGQIQARQFQLGVKLMF